MNNGRVDILHSQNMTDYKFFHEKYNNNDFQHQAIKNHFTENPVSNLFFSEFNFNTVQDGIRYKVYKETNNKLVIGKQSVTELQVIMRSIYLQYSRNVEVDIVEQVKELNSRVLDFCVPRILVELNQYVNYKNDLTTLPTPLEHAKNESMKGTKFLYVNEY